MILRPFALLSFALLLTHGASSQSPVFEAADLHISPPRTYHYFSGGLLHNDHYLLHDATIVDLIATAYGLDAENIQGGPPWIERDHFDLVAKAPPGTSKAALRLMLRALLVERFGLAVQDGVKPMPAFVLSVGKTKPKIKTAAGEGASDCADKTPPAAAGVVTQIVVACRNMTMDTFAQQLHAMAGGYLDKPVVNETNLAGTWDFDVKWTGRGQLEQAGSEGISIFDAVDKQLGMKLSLETAPRPVVLVVRVNRSPTPNRAGTEKVLPPAPPARFEVATIKPSKPGAEFDGRINGGQATLTGATMRFMMSYAWDLNQNDSESLAGPKWLDTDRFDILAKAGAPVQGFDSPNGMIDPSELQEMMRALLVERFEIKSHMEDRPVTAYTLLAVNPKLQKADPNNRTVCKEGPGADGKDPRVASPILNRLVTCTNMNMDEMGDELRLLASGFIYNKVLNATNLDGRYDFTLSFSSADRTTSAAAAGPGGASADPNGALSVFEALNRQLGLKLKKEKRPMPVLVIDQMEEKPTEN